MLRNLLKSTLRRAGYKIEKLDPLEESIPADYNRSPFLPCIYRGYLNRVPYFKNQLERIKGVEGHIVECGVSIRHGALLLTLLSEIVGIERTYYGFDPFKNFPEPVEKDEVTLSRARSTGRTRRRP